MTYNRKDLLAECLSAILRQSFHVEKTIIIDNASSDGTGEHLKENGYLDDGSVIYRRMDRNTGGSGGFYEGLKAARDLECDWIWLMDDDTVPSDDALEELLRKNDSIGENVSFLASSAYGPNGEFMNVPSISDTKAANGYRDWYCHLADSAVKLKDATFVSVLIKKDAAVRCGLPCRDYFIWGDDSEYTMRLIRHYGPAYIIGTSVVCHKRYNASALSLLKESDPERIRLYRHFYRNILINKKLYCSRGEFISFFLGAFRTAFRSLFSAHGISKFISVHKGVFGFLTRYGYFRDYISGQISSPNN